MEKTAVIYWSGTGNTEAMANAIAQGISQAGGEADLLLCSSFDAGTAGGYAKFAFGCPAMGDEVLEESEFEPFFSGIEGALSGKKVALFGSYGWGDGQWMRDWQDRVCAGGAVLFEEGLTANGAPEEAVCREFGKRFAAF